MLNVTLEGPQGSGKTLARQAIEQKLANFALPYEIQEIQSPGSLSSGRQVRPRFHAVVEITDSDWIKFIEYDQDCQILDAWTVAETKNSSQFIHFLEHLLVTQHPTGRMVLVMDNAAYHKSASSLAALSLVDASYSGHLVTDILL